MKPKKYKNSLDKISLFFLIFDLIALLMLVVGGEILRSNALINIAKN